MQKITFLLVFCFLQISLFAQVRLDVEGDAKIGGNTIIEGDAKIEGKLVLIQAVGDSSLFIGANAGISDNPSFSSSNINTFVGTNAGARNTSGFGNSFFGYNTGTKNRLGRGNSFFGGGAGEHNYNGDANCFFGVLAGGNNVSGQGNSFFGNGAGKNNYQNSNSFFGVNAGGNNTLGQSNVFIGRSAGWYNEKGSYNTFIGQDSGNLSGVDSLDKAIAIGYGARVNCNNCAVIGGGTINAVNVGIGTTTPTEKLHIEGENDVAIKAVAGDGNKSSLMLFEGSDSTGYEFEYDADYGLLFLHQRNLSDNNNGTLVSWDETGFMFVTHDMQVDGDLQVNGTFIHSDKRFKKQIKKIDQPLAALQRVNGVSYAFRNKEFAARNFSKDRTLGLIAQEVEKVFPMLVQEDEEGYKAVNYDGFIPVLIEATKTQQELIDQQQKENSALKTVLKHQSQKLVDQQQQINELKGVVEKLLAARTAPQKTNNHTLPLLQKASLGQNQPNPFNETTLIDYYLPRNVQNAKVQVTTLGGKVVGEVKLPEKGKGKVNIQAYTYPTGTYYYSLIVDGQIIETRKMVLMK